MVSAPAPAERSARNRVTTLTGWLTRCRVSPPTLMPAQLDSRVQAAATVGLWPTRSETRSAAWMAALRSKASVKRRVIFWSLDRCLTSILFRGVGPALQFRMNRTVAAISKTDIVDIAVMKDRFKVGAVVRQPGWRIVSRVAMSGNDKRGAVDERLQRVQPGQVSGHVPRLVAGTATVRERDLDIAEHVASTQGPAGFVQDSDVARSVRLVFDHRKERNLRYAPVDREGSQPIEFGQQTCGFSWPDIDGGLRFESAGVAQGGVDARAAGPSGNVGRQPRWPEQMIPVRVGVDDGHQLESSVPQSSEEVDNLGT